MYNPAKFRKNVLKISAKLVNEITYKFSLGKIQLGYSMLAFYKKKDN